MKLINQSAEIWQQEPNEIGIYKQIEKAARLCYRSGDKITDDSYRHFIEMLDNNGHLSPYEHGTVYLAIPTNDDYGAIKFYENNPYSRAVSAIQNDTPTACITTNYRVIKENGWKNDLKYLCEPTKYHHKRISVHITTSLGISRELNRHRCHSICEESTRYCNYSKDKFGNELTFIKPNWFNAPVGEYELYEDDDTLEGLDVYLIDDSKNPLMELTNAEKAFIRNCDDAERNYLEAIKDGWKPQQARDVLPLATKTELVHTAFEDDWQTFFKLRCSPAAHPMMQELANMIKELMCKNDKV